MKSNFKDIEEIENFPEDSKSALTKENMKEIFKYTDVKLPTAAELAQIAAAMPSKLTNEKKLSVALELYYDSWDYLEDIRKQRDNPSEQLQEYDEENNIIALYPHKNDIGECPARKFLKDNKIEIKTARTVLSNIEKHGGEKAKKIIEESKRETDAGTIYAFPKRFLEQVVAARKKKKSDSVSAGHKTRQEK